MKTKKIPVFLIYSTGHDEDYLAGTSLSETEAKQMLHELEKEPLRFGQKGWTLEVSVTGIPKASQLSLEDYHKLRGTLPLEQFVERYEDFCKTNDSEFRYCSSMSVEEYIQAHPITKSFINDKDL